MTSDSDSDSDSEDRAQDQGETAGRSEDRGGMELAGDTAADINNTAASGNTPAAIDTAAADTASAGPAVPAEAGTAGPGTVPHNAEVAIAAFPKLAHAQELQAVVAAAARDHAAAGGGGAHGGGVARRVVVVGGTAHLVTIHTPASAPAPPPCPPPPAAAAAPARVKEELLTSVAAESQPESEPSQPTAELTQASHHTGTLDSTEQSTDPAPDTQDIVTTMIDTSDFRMSEPATYQTLTTVNGRMTPPGYSHLGSHYATLTPLQPVTPGPLPPISSIQMGEKFGYSPIVTSTSQSFTVMQNQSLAQISLASPYSYEAKLGMSPPQGYQHMQQPSPGPLSPPPHQTQGYTHQNGLHSPHKQGGLSPNPYDYSSQVRDPQSPHDLSPTSGGDQEQSPTSDTGSYTSAAPGTYTATPLTSATNPSLAGGLASVSPHTISPVPQASPSLPPHHPHHSRELSPPSPQQTIPHPSPILPPTTILHHPNLHHAPQPHSAALKSPNSTTSSNGEIEEINTKELAQRISAELKRYSIPQAIFAQRVLCRSQGTLSDLLRNPKPWSKLKSGRETFRRMWKWLQEPEFQRMSALRLAGRTVDPSHFSPR